MLFLRRKGKKIPIKRKDPNTKRREMHRTRTTTLQEGEGVFSPLKRGPPFERDLFRKGRPGVGHEPLQRKYPLIAEGGAKRWGENGRKIDTLRRMRWGERLLWRGGKRGCSLCRPQEGRILFKKEKSHFREGITVVGRREKDSV